MKRFKREMRAAAQNAFNNFLLAEEDGLFQLQGSHLRLTLEEERASGLTRTQLAARRVAREQDREALFAQLRALKLRGHF